jgi:uncharacterized small protein (DUF1192 family)
MPDVPGDGAAGLRAANARLRDLLAERDAQIGELLAQLGVVAELREQVAVLQAQVAELAARAGQNSKNSSKPRRRTGWRSRRRSRCARSPGASPAGRRDSRV